MQVLATEARHAWCEQRGERRRIGTALVGEVAVGDWLLVFLDDARERISAQRAAEVQSALDLVWSVMQGQAGAAAAGFELPSQLSAQQMKALTGA